MPLHIHHQQLQQAPPSWSDGALIALPCEGSETASTWTWLMVLCCLRAVRVHDPHSAGCYWLPSLLNRAKLRAHAVLADL